MTFQLIKVPNHIESSENPPSYRTNWKVVGSTSESLVRSYLLSATPAIVASVYGILYRQDLRIRQLAYNQFSAQVPYGQRQNESGQWTWDFDTTGGTVHITNAKEEVSRYPETTAPDQKGAIAVDGDQVNGVSIVIPAMKINVQFSHPMGAITLSQAKFLNSITGCTNSDPFLTFAPGEVLFLGARGSDGTSTQSTVNYQFACSANIEGQTIGSIAGVAKKGWDVLWIRYEDAEADADSVTHPVRTPKFVYVDRVYEEIALSAALGFG